jgi:hypothetical protein
MWMRYSLKDLLWLTAIVAVGISGVVGAEHVFYYGGRASLPLALLLFWGAILVLIAGLGWVLFRLFGHR